MELWRSKTVYLLGFWPHTILHNDEGPYFEEPQLVFCVCTWGFSTLCLDLASRDLRFVRGIPNRSPPFFACVVQGKLTHHGNSNKGTSRFLRAVSDDERTKCMRKKEQQILRVRVWLHWFCFSWKPIHWCLRLETLPRTSKHLASLSSVLTFRQESATFSCRGQLVIFTA